MVATRPALIAGNWKMNFDHLQTIAFIQKLGWTLKDAKHDYAQTEVAVFPPFTDIRSAQTLIAADKLKIALGAQDISIHEPGAFTGEVAGAFIKKLECRFVITGHSERRSYHGEGDALVAEKSAVAVRNGLVPVICVGETAEDLEKHGPSAVPVAQLKVVLDKLSADDEIVVAYEPVWAIGSGTAATPEQAEQVCGALRATIAETFGDAAAERTRILYGGSVKAANIAAFMREPNVDGALVGGAALDVTEFSGIVRYRDHVGA